MCNEDAVELKITWEEAQELLRPPPNANPNIVMIEDQEFEEYNVSEFCWHPLMVYMDLFIRYCYSWPLLFPDPTIIFR